jgi:hypothetical protein
MPHLVHAVVSLTSGVVFFVVAILLVRRAWETGQPARAPLLAATASAALQGSAGLGTEAVFLCSALTLLMHAAAGAG